MRAIIRTSLRFRLLVVAVAAGVLALGVTQLRDAPVDVLPEFTPPYVEIQTEALGLSANEVEQLVTTPLEADLLNGVQDVQVLRSQSVAGMSSIVLVFRPGTDVYRGRQLVQERLTQMGAAAWPNISDPPTVLQPLSSSSRVVMVAIASEDVSPIERSVIARWTIRPALMGVRGVANVAVWGMRDQQLQVQVDPERLRDRGVTLDEIVRTTGNAQVFSPLSHLEASTPGTGGFIETPQQRLQVRNIFERLADPRQLGQVPVDGTGGRLRLGDVSDIRVDHQPLIGDAVVGDGAGLLLVVEKFPGADTRAVTRGVEDALERLRPGLAGMQADTSVFRPASYIDQAIDHIRLALAIGGLLLVLVLVAVLWQWRTVLLCAVCVPVSLAAAALVLDALGETLNAISFAGLAIAVAIVVDDAVAGAENVMRRVRQARDSGVAVSTTRVVQHATQEVRTPLLFATLVALLAIVPVAVMEGRPGAFLAPLVLAYAVAVGVSLVVAGTVTPALGRLLLARCALRSHESRAVRRIGARYVTALTAFVRRPRVPVLAASAIAVAGIAACAFLGTSLLPAFQDRDVLVRLTAEPGTSSPRMTETVRDAARELRSIRGVDDVVAHVGRAVTGDQIVGVNSSALWVGVSADADYGETLDDIDDAVARIEGVERQVTTYTAQKIRDVGALADGANPVTGSGFDVLTGTDAPLVARVYGQDPQVLRAQAERVRRAMAAVDGVVAPRVELPAEEPTLDIEVDIARARRAGIKPGDVRRAEATLLQGLKVGSVFRDQKVFDVIVQGTPETRSGVDAVRSLLIDRPDGGHVRLGQVADVRVAPSPSVIERESVSRFLDVAAGVRGRGAGAVADDVRAAVADLRFPLEYHAEVVERSTADEIGVTRVAGFALAAVLAAFLLLQAAFRSWALALVTLAMVPVALAGGALAALADGAELSLGSAAAFVALLGIAIRWCVVLTHRLEELHLHPAERFGLTLVQRGARDRFGPILATAAALAVLAAPFAVLGRGAGSELLHPMAVVLLGGLVTSAFVALFLVPAFYLRIGEQPKPRIEYDGTVVEEWAGFAAAGRARDFDGPDGAYVPAGEAGPPRTREAGDVDLPPQRGEEGEAR